MTQQQNGRPSWRRRVWLGLFGLIGAVVVIGGGVYVWALLARDQSVAARGILWGDADVDDWQRFPARSFAASDRPVVFPREDAPWLVDLTFSDPAQNIVDMPLPDYLAQSGTTAFIILHGDNLLYEGYFNGGGREEIATSMSVAKSFASTLVGIAIDEGYIGSLDDAVTAYIPELAERDSRFAAITLRHLLTMSSGISYQEETIPINDGTITYYAPDLRAAALNATIAEAPGARFHYNNYNALLLGMVLERATGMTVTEYLETRLWRPMGAAGGGSWSLDSDVSGFEKMESGLNARAIDFAKLGWLFLNEGRNGDRPVVPAAWVSEATRVDKTTDPAAQYQYFWWVDPGSGAFYAEGNYCQDIYVYPPADLVLVRLGRECGGIYWTGLLGDIAGWLEAHLVPTP